MNWGSIATDASKAIGDVGFDALLIRPGLRTGTQSKPNFGPPQEIAIKVVRMDLEKIRRKGTLVQGANSVYLIAAKGLHCPIGVSDKIRIGGKDHAVLSVETTSPGGQDVLYKVQAAG